MVALFARYCVQIGKGFYTLHNAGGKKAILVATVLQTYESRTTAHKTHTGVGFHVLRVLCVQRGISKLLITGHVESFNSVPGHHISQSARRFGAKRRRMDVSQNRMEGARSAFSGLGLGYMGPLLRVAGLLPKKE